MAYAVVVTAGANPTAGRPITLALLRRIALPAVAISGSTGSGELVDGAVIPSKVTPGAYTYAAGTYAAGDYSVLLSPALSALANGVALKFKADTQNAGAVTVSVNGLGAKALYKFDGVPLVKGDIRANQVVEIVYNTSWAAAAGAWQMISPTGNDEQHYESVVTTGTDAYVATFAPTVTALVDGMRLRWKVPNANTTAVTLAADGLAAKALKKGFNGALEDGDLKANQIVECVYESTTDTYQMVSPLAGEAGAAIVANSRNLLLTNNAGTPNSQIDITADEVVLKSTGGRSYVASTVSVTVNIASGVTVNGLDALPLEAASTWYYVWLIYKPSTGTMAGLLSLSSTVLVMPTGYSYKALVGAVRNDAGSNFLTVYQRDRRAWIVETVVFTAKAPAVAGTYENLSGADLTAFQALVPPIAKTVKGLAGCTTANPLVMVVAADNLGLGAVQCMGQNAAAFNNFTAAMEFEIPLKTSQNFFWKSVAGANQRIEVSGYTI